MACLAERLRREGWRTTDQLIEIHGLASRAAEEVLARVSNDFTSGRSWVKARSCGTGRDLSVPFRAWPPILATRWADPRWRGLVGTPYWGHRQRWRCKGEWYGARHRQR